MYLHAYAMTRDCFILQDFLARLFKAIQNISIVWNTHILTSALAWSSENSLAWIRQLSISKEFCISPSHNFGHERQQEMHISIIVFDLFIIIIRSDIGYCQCQLWRPLSSIRKPQDMQNPSHPIKWKWGIACVHQEDLANKSKWTIWAKTWRNSFED